ncbi:hypothetical protein RJ639_022350 [Escallonia herrerae]|uniref:Retrotransposon Copia-like N-terminal domain-containing protein n=1 Tax=Escallonia herrerae TaxID=1293975 RepID=A0AA88V6Y2_9ASTE|nr:hypothetical protein RJ639_022350 [Escallonia herrerae]
MNKQHAAKGSGVAQRFIFKDKKDTGPHQNPSILVQIKPTRVLELVYGNLRPEDSDTLPIVTDHPSHLIVPIKLNRADYPSWSKSMIHALTAKNKIGFINGSIEQPS